MGIETMISESKVKLVLPTDFLILEALAEHGRNVATNLEHHTGKTRKNINNRLPQLEDYGLVTKIGPAETSGLYELTRLGEIAVQERAMYRREDIDFEQHIRSILESDT